MLNLVACKDLLRHIKKTILQVLSLVAVELQLMPIFFEKYLYKEVAKINSRMKDTPAMLDTIDNI